MLTWIDIRMFDIHTHKYILDEEMSIGLKAKVIVYLHVHDSNALTIVLKCFDDCA